VIVPEDLPAFFKENSQIFYEISEISEGVSFNLSFNPFFDKIKLTSKRILRRFIILS